MKIGESKSLESWLPGNPLWDIMPLQCDVLPAKLVPKWPKPLFLRSTNHTRYVDIRCDDAIYLLWSVAKIGCKNWFLKQLIGLERNGKITGWPSGQKSEVKKMSWIGHLLFQMANFGTADFQEIWIGHLLFQMANFGTAGGWIGHF